jgi:Predicted membrane protein
MTILIGVVIMVLGLALRFNTLIVVIVAGAATGLAAGMTVMQILEAIGKAFITNRYMSLLILILPVIGILERHGLREQAERFIISLKAATAGRIMLLYMIFRQVTVALGLQLGGHPSFIRPIVSPMAEAAAGKGKVLPPGQLDKIRGMAASAENYGNFYGQLIFIAAPGLLLIKGVMDSAGYSVDLLTMAEYAIPTGLVALLLAAVRYALFDRAMGKAADNLPEAGGDGRGLSQ